MRGEERPALIVGAMILAQTPGPIQVADILMVTAAAIGATRSGPARTP